MTFTGDITVSGITAGTPVQTDSAIGISGNGNDLHVDLPGFKNGSLHIADVTAFSAGNMVELYNSSSYSQQFINGMGSDYFPYDAESPVAGFINNPFTTLSPPNLTTMDDFIYIHQNAYLCELDIPLLSSISGLAITANERLRNITFSALTMVANTLQIIGPLSSLTFPSLKDAAGSLYVSSTGSFDCSSLDAMQQEQDVFKSEYSCTGGGEAHSGLSTGAKAGLGVGIAAIGLGLISMAVLTWQCVRRRKNRRAAQLSSKEAERQSSDENAAEKQPELSGTEIKGMPSDMGGELPSGKLATELESPQMAHELGQDLVRHELDANGTDKFPEKE